MSCYDKVEARMVAYRNEQYTSLQDVLDWIILDVDYKIDLHEIMTCLQHSILKRQEHHTEIEPIYANIQMISDVIDALHPVTNMDVENDRLIDRTDKLEQVKIDISRIKAMA